MAIKKAESAPLHIESLKRGRITLRIIGETPLYFNAMSAKAKRDLLIGAGKKTAAQRKEIKHDPESEFSSSVYKMEEGETLLGFPAPGIKNAMATAALETPNVTKTSVQRLVFLPEPQVRIWGVPKLRMDVVRSADMNKTPDIRTRACLRSWCSQIDIAFVSPTLSAHSVISLLTNAGMIAGIGDFRQEKGRGSYGTFSVHGEEMDGEYQELWDRLTIQCGRGAQQEAMDNPVCYDQETAELLEFLRDERKRREA